MGDKGRAIPSQDPASSMRVEDSTQITAGIRWSEYDSLHIVGLIGDLELFLGDIRRWCVFLDILEDLACFCWGLFV